MPSRFGFYRLRHHFHPPQRIRQSRYHISSGASNRCLRRSPAQKSPQARSRKGCTRSPGDNSTWGHKHRPDAHEGARYAPRRASGNRAPARSRCSLRRNSPHRGSNLPMRAPRKAPRRRIIPQRQAPAHGSVHLEPPFIDPPFKGPTSGSEERFLRGGLVEGLSQGRA